MHLNLSGSWRTGISALVALFAFTGVARADFINIISDPANSTENLGTFSGSINYTPGVGTGTLIITLMNTSPLANGGFITGFVFNIDSADGSAAAALTSQTDPGDDFQNTGPTSGSPFGDFDAGAALDGNFLGGGGPSAGIAVGASASFTFTVTATDALLLTASDFMSGPNAFDFIVRFRGFEDDGSDKVPATIVPAPSALGLLLLGLGGFARRRRRE